MKKRKRRKKHPAGMISLRDLLAKVRVGFRPTQIHEDKKTYKRARQKERARKENDDDGSGEPSFFIPAPFPIFKTPAPNYNGKYLPATF